MSDEDDVLPPEFVQGTADSAGEPADISDPQKAGRQSDEIAGMAVVLGGIVMAFAQTDDADIR